MPQEQKRELGRELLLPTGAVLQDGIGIVVLVDTSGSMKDNVPETGGGEAAKIEIAKRVTLAAFNAIADFAEKNPGKTVLAGMTRFSGSVTEMLPLAPPNRAVAQSTVARLEAGGSTAIGDALVAAKQQLNKAKLKKQYMIVITDGMNTSGSRPEEVVAVLQALPQEQRATIYLIAFDVAAKVFEPLVKQGVAVSEARDAKSLQNALDYILYEKILVEQE
jgi:Mg-chelatase subunit ChlD